MKVEAVTERLELAGCVAADEEAAELVAAAPDRETLEAWVRRREDGEPLAWIIGRTEFCDGFVRVDPGVYVPRVQTEDLARRAARLLGASPRPVAADLCTGSGAIAAHLARAAPAAAVVGVDVDPRAVRCARRNGVRAVLGDLGAPLRSGAFGVVTAVVPYVPHDEIAFLPADVQRHEPRSALDGGEDGLAVARRAVLDASRLLCAGGWLLLELGGEQDQLLGPDLERAGFVDVTTWSDEDGDLRGLAARRSQQPSLS